MNIFFRTISKFHILWENREKNCDSQFIQNRAALGYMFITAYNSLKNKFNFIKYKLISKCTYIFCILCFSVE